MALRRKPHALTIRPASQPVNDDLTVEVTQYGANRRVYGQLMVLDPQAVYEATGLALTRPFRLFLDIADGADVKVGDRLAGGHAPLYRGSQLYRNGNTYRGKGSAAYDGLIFEAKAPVAVHAGGRRTNYCSVLIEQLDYAGVG